MNTKHRQEKTNKQETTGMCNDLLKSSGYDNVGMNTPYVGTKRGASTSRLSVIVIIV